MEEGPIEYRTPGNWRNEQSLVFLIPVPFYRKGRFFFRKIYGLFL